MGIYSWICFFLQAEDGIRDAQESRGLGDVYKRQILVCTVAVTLTSKMPSAIGVALTANWISTEGDSLSLIHI